MFTDLLKSSKINGTNQIKKAMHSNRKLGNAHRILKKKEIEGSIKHD